MLSGELAEGVVANAYEPRAPMYAPLRLHFFPPVMRAAEKWDGLVYSSQENEHFDAKLAVAQRAPLCVA